MLKIEIVPRLRQTFHARLCYTRRGVRGMEQTVWGDLLFFVNFCMDFQCLFLTARLLHRRFSVRRGALASAGGAVYAVAALFLTVGRVAAFFLDLLMCALMCLLTFGERHGRLRRLYIPFAVYFGVSAAVGGVMTGLSAWLNRLTLPAADTASGPWFYVLAAAGGLLTFLWGRLCQRRAKGKHATLRVVFGKKAATFTCMTDTGNLLTDPVSGRPVVIVSRRSAGTLLPASLLCGTVKEYGAVVDLPAEWARRVRLIPSTSATGSGLLLAVMPDSAALDAGRGARPVDLLLAPTPFNPGAGYEALLPATLITE